MPFREVRWLAERRGFLRVVGAVAVDCGLPASAACPCTLRCRCECSVQRCLPPALPFFLQGTMNTTCPRSWEVPSLACDGFVCTGIDNCQNISTSGPCRCITCNPGFERSNWKCVALPPGTFVASLPLAPAPAPLAAGVLLPPSPAPAPAITPVTPASSEPEQASASSSSGMSTGALAGIAAGSVVAVAGAQQQRAATYCSLCLLCVLPRLLTASPSSALPLPCSLCCDRFAVIPPAPAAAAGWAAAAGRSKQQGHHFSAF